MGLLLSIESVGYLAPQDLKMILSRSRRPVRTTSFFALSLGVTLLLSACSSDGAVGPVGPGTAQPRALMSLAALAPILHDGSDMFITPMEEHSLAGLVQAGVDDLAKQLLAGNVEGTLRGYASVKGLMVNLGEVSDVELGPVNHALNYTEIRANELIRQAGY